MRDYRFRGKCKNDGEWVYGSLLRDFGKATWIVNTIQDIKDATSDNVWFQVDPKTVGQYTELPDKNGKEIYEGDVVGAFCDTQRFEIKYCEKRGGYFLDGVVLCGGAEPAPECLGNLLDTVEVIGNIHEHPHLLEGGELRG